MHEIQQGVKNENVSKISIKMIFLLFSFLHLSVCILNEIIFEREQRKGMLGCIVDELAMALIILRKKENLTAGRCDNFFLCFV